MVPVLHHSRRRLCYRSVVLGSMLFLLAGCNGSPASVTDGISTSANSPASFEAVLSSQASSLTVHSSIPDGARTTGESIASLPSSSSSSSSPVPVSSNHRTIAIEAKNWAFVPSTITVRKGEVVDLRITATSGTHGFAVPALGINQKISEGQTVTVKLPTEMTGTFDVFCSIPCGKGHRAMHALIVVTQ